MNPRRTHSAQEVPERPRARPRVQAIPLPSITVAEHGQGDHSTSTVKEINITFAYVVFSNAVYYPIRMATILIQMGYEPCCTLGRNLLGRESYMLLNTFAYARHVAAVEGWSGCFRGFRHFLLHQLLYSNIQDGVSRAFVSYVEPNLRQEIRQIAHTEDTEAQAEVPEALEMGAAGDMDSDSDSDETDDGQLIILTEDIRSKVNSILFKYQCYQVVRDVVSRGVATVISYPLRTATYLAISEFVSRDGVMSGGFVSGLSYIYRTRGIAGFYGGLGPRLIGESLTICMIGCVNYTLRAHFYFLPMTLNATLTYALSILAGALTYPFQVVSITMAVAKSGLKYGCPPYMQNFSNWRKCWAHLSATNMLNRGSGYIFRQYNGPLTENGAIRPTMGINIGSSLRDGFPNPALTKL